MIVLCAFVLPGLLTFYLGFRRWLPAPDDEECDGDALSATIAALFAAAFWPFGLLILAATREPAHVRLARQRAEIAELQAREALALAERNRLLGLTP